MPPRRSAPLGPPPVQHSNKVFGLNIKTDERFEEMICVVALHNPELELSHVYSTADLRWEYTTPPEQLTVEDMLRTPQAKTAKRPSPEMDIRSGRGRGAVPGPGLDMMAPRFVVGGGAVLKGPDFFC